MIVINKHYALKNINSAQESRASGNTQGETLTIQVEGNATSMQIQVLGKSDLESNAYSVLMGFNISTLDTVSEISALGLYSFPIEGIAEYKINVVAVSGGSISVFCRETKG